MTTVLFGLTDSFLSLQQFSTILSAMWLISERVLANLLRTTIGKSSAYPRQYKPFTDSFPSRLFVDWFLSMFKSTFNVQESGYSSILDNATNIALVLDSSCHPFLTSFSEIPWHTPSLSALPDYRLMPAHTLLLHILFPALQPLIREN